MQSRSTLILSDLPQSLEGTVMEFVEDSNPSWSTYYTGKGYLHVLEYDRYNVLVDIMVSEYIVDSNVLNGGYYEGLRILKTQPS